MNLQFYTKKKRSFYDAAFKITASMIVKMCTIGFNQPLKKLEVSLNNILILIIQNFN